MSCKRDMLWMLVTLAILCILIGVPLLIYNAIVKPKDPKFTLEHASITRFNITSDGHFTTYFNVTIRANNPNHKLKLKYSGIRVSILKNNQKLAEAALDNFTQGKRNVTMLRSEAVVALNVRLKESSRFDFRSESDVGYLDVHVFMNATLNSNILEVNCKHAIVYITAHTNNTGHSFRRVGCSVRVFNDDYWRGPKL